MSSLLYTLSHTDPTWLRLVGSGSLRVDIRSDSTLQQGVTNDINIVSYMNVSLDLISTSNLVAMLP